MRSRCSARANLVDIVDLMATYTATATRLTAFNQHMPPGWKQFLPLPFTMPDDIHPDSRSRLPLVRTKTQQPASQPVRDVSSRPRAPGPNHIARHAGSLASLEASQGKRITSLAVLVTAREHDSQYDWTMNEPVAVEGRTSIRASSTWCAVECRWTVWATKKRRSSSSAASCSRLTM